MKVFIITEGNSNIGFGHITRGISPYQTFEERGIIPKFIGGANAVFSLKPEEFKVMVKSVKEVEKARFNLFVGNWEKIKKHDFTTISQSLEEATSHKVKDFDGLCEINPNNTCTVSELLNQLRTLTFPPYDNAYVEIDGQKY